MAIAALLPLPRAVFYDPNGAPLAGGFVYTYVPGGTTPATTWQDAAETTPNSNPIVLDANGSCLLYGFGPYQITVTDAQNNQVPAYSGLTLAEQSLLTLAVNVSDPSQAPSSYGNYNSITTAFTGDLSHCQVPLSQSISGVASLGQPTTGYKYTPELAAQFTYLNNASGWNQSVSMGDGRTAATAFFTKVDNYGQGDCVAFASLGYVQGAKPGATSWLANPAVSSYYSDVQAGSSGVYLNPVEIDCTDNGYDVAAINFVGNLTRTNALAALGENWIGYRAQSSGTAAADAIISAAGGFTIGIDLTTTSLGTNAGAITLAQGQRIYFASTNTTGFPLGTNATGPYIVSVDGLLNMVNGSDQLQVSTVQVTTLSNTQIGGNIFPAVDNAYTCGGSSVRWASVWAVNGTIQTSDPSLKTEVAPVTSGLSIISRLNPVTFKWKVGGLDATKIENSFFTKERPGKRTHWGFLAPEVKAAFDADGLDFGGYVRDEAGIEGIRPDQLIPVLVKAVQELKALVTDQAAEIKKLHTGATG